MDKRDISTFESEQIDLKSILSRYLKYWYLFLAAILLCVGGAYVYLLHATPQYYVSSTLLLKDDESGRASFDLSGLTGADILQPNKKVENEIVVLKAKSLMQRTLEDLELYTSYFVEDEVKLVEIYGEDLPAKVLVGQMNDSAYGKTVTMHIRDNSQFDLIEEDGSKSSHKFGQEIKKPYGTFTVVMAAGAITPDSPKDILVKFNDMREMAISYSDRLDIAPVNKDANVIRIALIDPVPQKGKDIVNKLIEMYNVEDDEEKNLIAANAIDFIDERLKLLTAELTDVEKNVEQYKRKNEVTDIGSQAKMYMEKASDYNQQLTDWSIQIDVLESIERYLSNRETENELVPSTLNIQDPTLLGLIGKFNELQLERQRMLRTTQPSNPIVQGMTDQLTNLRTNILENLRNIKNSLIITRDQLQANYAQFETRVQEVPSIERDLLEINRQQGTKQELYLYLLQKREESALSLVANVSNSRVIDAATAEEEPVLPKTNLIYVLAVLLGLGLPFAGIYLKDALNDKIQGLRDVEVATTAPILGEVTYKKARYPLVVTQDSRTTVAEQFRQIRANLQFAFIGKENKVILVTSSMSGEGKTFFSLNLGASLVLTGKRVVVLSFDLRKPALLQSLNLPNEEGITNYLMADDVNVEDIVCPSGTLPDLFVVGSGPVPLNPSELMLLPKVGKMIDELKEVFDHIIIDTAPVGQVADALALAPYINSSIYVVRNNYTYKKQIKIIDDIYKNQKFKHAMIVVNGAKVEAGYGYGYGYKETASASKNRSRKVEA
ncbi:GumC family protein [Pontibacter russatus]|uniref:GumC family protein n=1 Tax=Pontibacter russatus TaxID=2694929 RepID=UPI0013798F01|nr:tyrosine-protein kinase [Pontibacter russatus]